MKFVIFLGLAFCLLAAIHAQDEEVKKNVEKLIQIFVGKIQSLFDAAIAKAQLLVDNLFETINKSIEADINALGDILNEIEKVAAKGEKYERCYLEQKIVLKQISDKYAAQIAECEQDTTDKTKAVIDGLIDQAIDIQKEVGQIAPKCFEQQPNNAYACASRDANGLHSKATVNIDQSMLEAHLTIAQTSVYATAMIKAAFDESNLAYQKILKDIEVCAAA